MDNQKSFNLDFNLEKCAFCGKNSELKESHIIPRSFSKWIKKTSSTGYFRSSENPNIRQQDVWKTKLLCGECEQKFGSFEKKFIEEIFKPYHESPNQVLEYDIWLPKFIASINWRVLKCFELAGILDNYPRNFQTLVPIALSRWHDFIDDSIKNPGSFQLHFLPIDSLSDYKGMRLPPNFNRYMARAFGIDVVYFKELSFTFTKLAKIILFGFIDTPSQNWKGTRVKIGKGVSVPQTTYKISGEILKYFIHRSQKIQEIEDSYSENQRKKIDNFIIDNPDKITGSEMFEAFKKDLQMFGSRAFRKE